METIADLKSRIVGQGTLQWIGVSAEPNSQIESLDEETVAVGTGLDHDHHARSNTGKSIRQVTLVQSEHLPMVAEWLKREVTPELLRRNLVVAGINLLSLKDRQFQIGEVVLEGTGPCAPCSRMEWTLGTGGYSAMRGHGGITTRVIRGGRIRVGDAVIPLLTPVGESDTVESGT